jgi:hypothetical protein
MTPSQETRLVRAVRDGDARQLGATARELAAAADPVRTARTLLAGDDEGRREFAARLLGEVAARGGASADAAVVALGELAHPGETHPVLCAALEALGGLSDASAAREPLLGLVTHPSFSIRWRLAAALRAAHTDDPRVEAALVALAADPRPIVRLEAVDALALLWPPRSRAVDDALRAACEDPDERTVVSALVGLARARVHLPAEPLARALAPERMAAAPSGAAERLLTALAHSGRPEAHAPLRNLALLWKPRDPVVARALAAAVAACAPAAGDAPAGGRVRATAGP